MTPYPIKLVRAFGFMLIFANRISISMIRFNIIRILLLTIGFSFLFISCQESYTPKARAYFRIHYPEHRYTSYTNPCGFAFKLPEYARVEQDHSEEAEPCWYNIVYMPFNAKLHISYKMIENPKNFYELTEESRDFVYRHSVKASEISENMILNDHGLGGVFYELEGSTATAVQFFVTDSSKYFLRAALYFEDKINRDSLDPIIDFLKVDIKEMIKTIHWPAASVNK